ncbi:FAD binding domain-containing protein [Aeromicrobium wangtongii]|uniref:FAD binding domain-containing protein n=1 Tax=Aeromicrobium wangtongii TaxID=2969247 RepID=A0ABY5MCA9_9ACTN|nr:FAD binding domain-containing protein [Aeromicrobium wangtongii]MCD9196843.1 FAD binding domain-containing protein [Aeromicrobium wangtongii]UUP14352.1 FAD binding domain-containing protein [Aeromicrobium wangtongii]
MDLSSITSMRAARSRDDLALAPGESLLAGGSWLFSEPQSATSGLVDLTTMGWEPWCIGPAGLSIAATCTIAELLEPPAPADWTAAPLFRQCAEAFLMSFKIWNTATVGGNLCLALPAGAMISLATALDASCVVWTPDGGERHEPVSSFVRGAGRTSLAEGEVLRSVELPIGALQGRTAFRTIALTPLGRSSAVVIGRLDPDERLTLAVTAATTRPHVFRFGHPPTDDEVQDALRTIEDWYSDAHGAPDWRAAMTHQLAYEVCEELKP